VFWKVQTPCEFSVFGFFSWLLGGCVLWNDINLKLSWCFVMSFYLNKLYYSNISNGFENKSRTHYQRHLGIFQQTNLVFRNHWLLTTHYISYVNIIYCENEIRLSNYFIIKLCRTEGRMWRTTRSTTCDSRWKSTEMLVGTKTVSLFVVTVRLLFFDIYKGQ
jgi:hypothetical protein